MFANMKIGSRIILALVLPILGLTFFAGFLVLEKRQVSTNMEALQELATIAPTISEAPVRMPISPPAPIMAGIHAGVSLIITAEAIDDLEEDSPSDSTAVSLP